ncbi:SLATT domain-containing protein, partial [Rossellomorea marisflavi]|uniref:SLATT domain-containing protein n=1 Tax=Rossellomorea marisflavi TaxID=189381 RepID=UPI00064F33EF
MGEANGRNEGEIQISNAELVEEPQTTLDETTKSDIDIEKHGEERSNETVENILLNEIKGLFQNQNDSGTQNTKVLNEIKALLVGLTPVTKGNLDKEKTLIDEITHFKEQRVWVTKKTRMESEARMNNNNIFSLFVVNFYTLIVLSLSIVGLVSIDEEIIDRISVLTVISSVALFGISLFVSLYGYKEKANSYKQCYLDLTRIESQCQNLILSDLDYKSRISNFNEIKKEYNHILEKTDNHSNADRLVYLRNNKKLDSLENQIAYYRYKFIKG